MNDIEYRRAYRRNYYRSRRLEIIGEMGGKCSVCGSTENLQIDHVDAELKVFNVGSRLDCARKTIESELNKCQLLCQKCHLEKTKVDLGIKLSGDKNAFYDKHGAEFPSSRPIVDLDKWDEYESASDFAFKHGLDPNSVTRVCRGERKAIHGHHVIYRDCMDDFYMPYLGNDSLFSSIEHVEIGSIS